MAGWSNTPLGADVQFWLGRLFRVGLDLHRVLFLLVSSCSETDVVMETAAVSGTEMLFKHTRDRQFVV